MSIFNKQRDKSASGLIQSPTALMVCFLVAVFALGSCSDSKEPKVKMSDDAATSESGSLDTSGGVTPKVAVTPPAREMEVTVTELKSALEKDEDIFLMDVRSMAEFDVGHIAEVDTLIPHTEFAGQGVNLPVDKDQYIYVICRSGHRSGMTLKWLRDNGYGRSYNVIGGMLAWADSGYPVEGSGAER